MQNHPRFPGHPARRGPRGGCWQRGCCRGGGVNICKWDPKSPSLFPPLSSLFAWEVSEAENKKGFHEIEVKRGWKVRKSSLNAQELGTSIGNRGDILPPSPPPRLPLRHSADMVYSANLPHSIYSCL